LYKALEKATKSIEDKDELFMKNNTEIEKYKAEIEKYKSVVDRL
jgi:peptidoglycan hydrolase CwlO-like protein